MPYPNDVVYALEWAVKKARAESKASSDPQIKGTILPTLESLVDQARRDANPKAG